MARSKNTRARKVLSLALCAAVITSMTGCAAIEQSRPFIKLADKLRPDLNLDGDLRLFAGLDDVGDDDVQPGMEVAVWPSSNYHNNDYNYASSQQIVDPQNFKAPVEDFISASDYSVYLEKQVYDKIMEIVGELDEETQAKLYVRVSHVGYDKVTDTTAKKVIGCQLVHEGSAVSSSGAVAGQSLIVFANRWLGCLSQNASYLEQNQSSALNYLAPFLGVDNAGAELTPEALEGTEFPASYLAMMVRTGAGIENLGQYASAIENYPYKNIPNFKMYYRTDATSATKTITFNKIKNGECQFGVDRETVNRLFDVSYNQYLDRRYTGDDSGYIDTMFYDDYGYVRCYIDGYNKTIVYVGMYADADSDETLAGLLGYEEGDSDSNFHKILNLIGMGRVTAEDTSGIFAVAGDANIDAIINMSHTTDEGDTVYYGDFASRVVKTTMKGAN